MIKDIFISALNKLKVRNQDYVNKHGINKYSIENDEIIQDLVNYYNQSIKSIEKIEFLESKLYLLKTIIDLFNIPVEYQDYHLEFLKNELKQKKITGDLIVQPMIYLMDIDCKYNSFNCVISNMIMDIESILFARQLNLKLLTEHLEKVTHPLLRDISEDNTQMNYDELFDYLTKEYYAQNINP